MNGNLFLRLKCSAKYKHLLKVLYKLKAQMGGCLSGIGILKIVLEPIENDLSLVHVKTDNTNILTIYEQVKNHRHYKHCSKFSLRLFKNFFSHTKSLLLQQQKFHCKS